ncbi:MAG: hypothetical protein HOL51_04990 [Gemmatimonadetes bacterium]|nr:hypothetical protein [Gemmatimonadota bacterium]MBT6619146.1 hypothetical protein [Gemmatimonadota bacterium]
MAYLVSIATAFLIIVQFGAGWFFPNVLWGINHWAFFPAPIQLASIGIGLCIVAVPYFTDFPSQYRLPQVPTIALYLSIGSCSFILFYLLGIDHNLLGDGDLIARETGAQRDFDFGIKNAVYFHQLAYAFIRNFLPAMEWAHTYALVSCFSGMFFSQIALFTARSITANSTRRFCAFTAIVGTGGIQYYFGYIEEYPLTTLLVGSVLAFIMRWNGNRNGWLWAGTLSAVAAFFAHPIAIFTLVPICLGHAYQAINYRSTQKPQSILSAMTSIAMLLFPIAWITHTGIWSASATNHSVYMFSAAHSLDALNVYLLVVPLHGVICIGLLSSVALRRNGRDPTLICLVAGAGSAWSISILIEPVLGRLDWDLLSIYAIPWGLLTAYLIATYAQYDTVRHLKWCLPVILFLHVAPWVITNADKRRSITMVEAMVHEDFHHTGSRIGKLGGKFEQIEMFEAASRQYELALKENPEDPLALYNLGMLTYSQRSVHRGLSILRRFMALVPNPEQQLLVQSLFAYHAGQQSDAAITLANYLINNPSDNSALGYAVKLQKQVHSTRGSRLL